MEVEATNVIPDSVKEKLSQKSAMYVAIIYKLLVI